MHLLNMSFARAWFLIVVALFVTAVVIFFCHVSPVQSEQVVMPEQVLIEPTAEDYAKICSLDTVECPNEGKPTTVTGYTSRPEETDDTPCIAAFGHDICARKAKGLNTCASNDYPRGATLHVEGLGNCTVLDRMNKRYTGTGRVDWYFGNDLKAARAWGKQTVLVARD